MAILFTNIFTIKIYFYPPCDDEIDLVNCLLTKWKMYGTNIFMKNRIRGFLCRYSVNNEVQTCMYSLNKNFRIPG